MSKRLILLGGGHAHIHVLQAFAREPLAGAELLLITPHPQLVYSGMVPGLVAGHYSAAQCAIALAPLAAAARARLVLSSAVGLDAGARRVLLADGRSAEYDVLSLDTGAVMDRQRLLGAPERGLFVRPMENFARLLPAVVELAATRVLDVVVLGGGAAGVELALALQYRLAAGEERARVALVTGGPPVLAGYPAAVGRRATQVLARRRVTIWPEACVGIEPAAVVMASGARLACDVPVIATGGEAPGWLAGSGLALDAQGFVRTGPTLQSRSHPEVFAVGDVASRDDAPHPRSGVHAVRAGPGLALNLRRGVGAGPLKPHRPPARTLNLISCGDRSAIASFGDWSAQGRWVWWWKDRIDRAFVTRYSVAQVAPLTPCG